MRKIFISSHASYASGIMSSAQFLMGKVDHVTVFDAYLDQRSVESQVEAFLDNVDCQDQVILISDLYGGSVNQILYRYLGRDNTFLVTGANLALILELISSKEHMSEQELDEKIDLAKSMMMRVKYEDEEVKEEEFF